MTQVASETLLVNC